MSPTRPVRISAGYSDKISENYNSKQFSINLELDANINGSTQEIEDASARLFELCRKIVEQQKGVSVDNLLSPVPSQPPPQQLPPSQNYSPQPPQQNQPQQPANNNGSVKLASDKQIKFIFSLAKKNKLPDYEVRNLPMQYNIQNFNELSSKQASEIIESLSGSKAA